MSRGIHGDLVLGKTPSGRRFKAYLYGQMIGHIQDWVGPNYRLKPLDKQPPNGFATIEEAFTHARTLFPTEADLPPE